MPLFKTFRAKIYSAVAIRTGDETSIDQTITFSKYKILLKEEQINRIYFDPLLVQVVAHKAEYDFDKIRNKEDEKQFSIILKQKLNVLDKGIHHLNISKWNKFRANIIHNKYWIDKEKEWFIKTIIATTIGALFALMGAYVGYKAGLRNSQPPTIIKTPSQIPQGRQ